MIDFSFIKKLDEKELKLLILRNDRSKLLEYLESRRTSVPFVGEIETTNACSFECIMCPRGRGKMTREIGFMTQSLFNDLVHQIRDNSNYYNNQIQNFQSIDKYFEVCGLRLHHFGDPLLDPLISSRIDLLKTITHLPVHFSTCPQNLTNELIKELLTSGLDRIVFALDAMDQKAFSVIRGSKWNLFQIIDNVEKMIIESRKQNAKIAIDVQMIKLQANIDQQAQFESFWSKKPVRILIKDFAPYPDVPTNIAPTSKIHKDFSNLYIPYVCKRPFYSLTVLYDGKVVPCSFDYNGENIIGDLNYQSLEQIWNGDRFHNFRQKFTTGKLSNGNLCYRCGQYLWKDQFR